MKKVQQKDREESMVTMLLQSIESDSKRSRDLIFIVILLGIFCFLITLNNRDSSWAKSKLSRLDTVCKELKKARYSLDENCNQCKQIDDKIFFLEPIDSKCQNYPSMHDTHEFDFVKANENIAIADKFNISTFEDLEKRSTSLHDHMLDGFVLIKMPLIGLSIHSNDTGLLFCISFFILYSLLRLSLIRERASLLNYDNYLVDAEIDFLRRSYFEKLADSKILLAIPEEMYPFTGKENKYVSAAYRIAFFIFVLALLGFPILLLGNFIRTDYNTLDIASRYGPLAYNSAFTYCILAFILGLITAFIAASCINQIIMYSANDYERKIRYKYKNELEVLVFFYLGLKIPNNSKASET